MLRLRRITFFLPLFMFSLACNVGVKEKGSEEEKLEKMTAEPTLLTPVRLFALGKTVFHQEIIANGKVQAPKKANLVFQGNGVISTIHVREGSRVNKGQVLAALDVSQQEREGLQANLKYEQALLDYQDQLLRAGYQLKDTVSLSKDILGVAKLRSGLSAAELEIQRNHAERQNGVLVAPFAGKIANLLAKPHNASNGYEYICTLIDDSALEVEFQVLEQELGFMRQSRSIRIQAFSGGEKSYTGQITTINPVVDESGMITVKAIVQNGGGDLMDGMSVRIVILNTVPEMLVVPKTAVLDRQSRKVVFTEEGGIAKWNYVEIAAENSEEYAIASGLKAGDNVIYEGNFNLAHEKKIQVTE